MPMEPRVYCPNKTSQQRNSFSLAEHLDRELGVPQKMVISHRRRPRGLEAFCNL
jgi:hypothetical protein